MKTRAFLLASLLLGFAIGVLMMPVPVLLFALVGVTVLGARRARVRRAERLPDGWKPVSGTVDSRRPRRQ